MDRATLVMFVGLWIAVVILGVTIAVLDDRIVRIEEILKVFARAIDMMQEENRPEEKGESENVVTSESRKS